jgi:hypothetical protein
VELADEGGIMSVIVKGDLVQLLDVHGKPHEETLGTVLGTCPARGNVLVHWHAGVPNEFGAAYQWGRLEVVAT